MLYKIITVYACDFMGTDFEKAAEKLSGLVNKEMTQGWRPMGGVATGNSASTHEPYLFQAMIKE
jgi:hypothetical protein